MTYELILTTHDKMKADDYRLDHGDIELFRKGVIVAVVPSGHWALLRRIEN